METERICVIGIVQGVGFRPFVSRLAHSCHIRGTVCNKGSYVEIIIQGSKSAKEQFVNYLPRKAPARSAILKIMTEQTDLPPFSDFSIIESAAEEGDVFVSPDIAICDDCKKELFDPQNRRYLHPFINCTACGPRMTILDAMPYDRELQLKLEQYEAVLNYTHDGILAINKEGNIVVVNRQAEEILPLKNKPYEGKYIEEVFPSSKLSSVLRTGEKEMDELMKTGNVVINTNRIPIMVNGKIEGVVATFKDVDSIRNSEQKIRTNLHKRGMVARYRFSDIVGESKVMKRAIYMAKSFAKYDANILIQGEIGTGKEMFAHAIHHESQRRNHPFLAVNCSNISADRLTRQLLGREKEGELFGSPESQEGAFELAHGGTLFLDKIDEAPLEAQSDILRILEDNEVCRINGRHTISVDVRIIASAGNGLQKKMQIGDFLEELYYKISVLSLEIPPLRNREADYLLLSENLFHRYFGSEYYMYESKIRKIEEYMQNYIWKGNIRELQNFVQRVSVLLKNAMPVDEIMLTMPENSMMNDTSIDVKMNKWSRAHVVDALTASKLNITKAARMLGCSRGTLYKKMNELNIKISNIE